MPMTQSEFEKATDLRALSEDIVAKLKRIGKELGFESAPEFPTNGGKIDLVWLLNLGHIVGTLPQKVPIVGFEIESSWRTRKHIKGDIFNLLELSPSAGIILFITKGFQSKSKLAGNLDAAKRYISGFSGISRLLVWTDEDVKEVYHRLLGFVE